MDKTLLTLSFPESTHLALVQLTKDTGVSDMARLIQDALRTYEWILFQQAEGRKIVALEDNDLKTLETTPTLNGTRPVLTNLLV